MYLDLNNILYYLYDYGYVDESELFNEKFDVAKSDSLNSVFLVRFNKTILVVKQAYNTGKSKEIALKKDAYFMNELYREKFYPKNKFSELIDESKLIYTRKGIFSDTKIYESIKNNKFNEWEKLLNSINNLHIKINEEGFINFLVNGIPPEYDSLIFSIKIPIYIPKQSIEYSNSQKFWRKVNPEIIDLINYSTKNISSGEYIDPDKIKFNKGTLIHGDLSMKNILYDDRHKETKEEKAFYLIDWEMCQYGDTMWDYATLYAEKVFFDTNKIPDFFVNIDRYIARKFSDRIASFKLYSILAQIKRLNQLLNLNSLSFDDVTSRLYLLNEEFKQL